MRFSFYPVFITVTLALMVLFSAYLVSSRPEKPLVNDQSFAFFELQGAVVEGFPEVPLYPDSILKGSHKKQERGLTGFETDLTTENSPQMVYLWYLRELQAAGWEVVTPPESPEISRSLFAQYEKDGMKLNLNIENEETGETEIMLEFPLQQL